MMLQEPRNKQMVHSSLQLRTGHAATAGLAGSHAPLGQQGKYLQRLQRISAPQTREAAAAICGQPENNTDLSPDEVKLGVTLHTSGTLETDGHGEKQDVTQPSRRFHQQ